ncbi:MAG: hypothetical protein Tsb0016_27610 [Sphingomonadales bacterium]
MQETNTETMSLDCLSEEMPHLRRYARSLVRQPDLADDLVQDCLEKAVTHIDKFTVGTDLRCWLFTIMRNSHIDAMRKQQRRGPHVEIEEWYRETWRPPEQEHYLRVQDVVAAMEKLRPCDQEVVRLVVAEGMLYKDVARRLGVAVGTVKSRLSRARHVLNAA